MSLWSRFTNVFRPGRTRMEIEDELRSHIEEAAEQGRDPVEARRSFGSVLSTREASHDVRTLPWLDSLRADAIFGWRQLKKHKITSTAAILSLAIGIGACTSAFRLIDAVLLRPLPVANAERLYSLVRQGIDFNGRPAMTDLWAYPGFRLMRAAVKGEADLIAVSYDERTDVTYGSDQEMEKAHVQYVSGWMFGAFGLKPAIGRLFTEADDATPGAHPYAVISYDYWARRFGRDPHIVGRTIRMGQAGLLEIIGVVDRPFTGTEPGTMIEIFVPTMMHPGVTHDDWTWHRTLVSLKPGVAMEPVRARLHAISRAFEEERAKGFKNMTKESIAKSLDYKVNMLPAAAGASGMQRNYRPALWALGILVALVLLIACANVANLMTAQAASRAREMALRVSIGAGRGRLVQLVLVESAMLALFSAGAGALFAWWSAPFVVARINPPDNPARLDLPADWRVLAFGLALTMAVTLLFGLAPALRASGVKPSTALKDGADMSARRRMMLVLIAAQTAFCFLVTFAAGLFAASFDRLAHQPIGFRAEQLLALDTVAQHAQPAAVWDQLLYRLRAMPGVESVALAGWPLLGGGAWNGFISVDGGPPGPVLGYFLTVSPGWLETMKIPLTEGRDFRDNDTMPGSAIVNESFVKQFLSGRRVLGVSFNKGNLGFRVIGVVHDVPYRDLRETNVPVAYVPVHALGNKGELAPLRGATCLVRTVSRNPLSLASTLRQEIPRASPGFRVSNIRTQQEIVDAQTVRERLLATLAMFFAMVALVLAGIGLYGVLDYTVVQRRREIGIRMALGARAGHVAASVTTVALSVVLAGAVVGVLVGLASRRFADPLLYRVNTTDVAMVLAPLLTIVAFAAMAAVPAVIRSVRIDPAITLRAQ